ncbi:Formin-like protein 12 [Astathelohania contejeani]|uniref:Formin-like protein 12 n=1 Tax=Astathelohania contejeani TaxID=164912 RepID=A0ABQ7I0K4_9MICR|nr:Formin-like protein 12 [Thelohania contejeani]
MAEIKKSNLSKRSRINENILAKINSLQASYKKDACFNTKYNQKEDENTLAPIELNCKYDKNGLDANEIPAINFLTAECSSNINECPFDITKITDRLFVSGQCWNNRTEKFSGRNNINEFNEYLKKRFNSKFMVWCFDTNEHSGFQNAAVFKKPGYFISEILAICKSVQGWLQLNEKNVVIIESRGSKYKFALLICCILKYCSYTKSMEDAMALYSKKRNIYLKNNTMERYCNYFETFQMQSETKYPHLLLHQIIVITNPMVNGKCNPSIKIFQDEKLIYTLDEEDIMIRDENYIIANFPDIPVQGDLQICLFHNTGDLSFMIFELTLNTFAYDHGLFRFLVDDVDHTLSDKISFHEDFSVDVVLCGNEECDIKIPYVFITSFIANLKVLSEHIIGNYNKEQFKILVDDGYNRICSKVFLQLGYSVEEAKSEIKAISSLLVAETKKNQNVLKDKILKIIEKPEFKKEKKYMLTRIPIKEQNLSKFTIDETLEIRDIEYIPDSFESIKIEKEKTKMKLPPKRNANAEFKKLDGNLVIRKPLHWIALNTTKESIFEELETIQIKIDYKKFEEWFCEPRKTIANNKIIEKDKSLICDDRRIFLVSMAIKTLETRNLNLENIISIIYTKHEELSNEDLLNIFKILPTEPEMAVFNAFKGDIQTLNIIEQYMIQLGSHQELKYVLDILIFERHFYEESLLLNKLLDDLKAEFNNILENNNLRIIIKTILELGNAINYKYSFKSKKKTMGFKLSSLYLLHIYRGNSKDQSLFNFFMFTLQRNKPETLSIFKELSNIHTIKNLDLVHIKDQCNKLITGYKKSIEHIKYIDSGTAIYWKLRKFIFYSYEYLAMLASKYRETYVFASILKRKFGEDENGSINEILNNLSSLLNKMEESMTDINTEESEQR